MKNKIIGYGIGIALVLALALFMFRKPAQQEEPAEEPTAVVETAKKKPAPVEEKEPLQEQEKEKAVAQAPAPKEETPPLPPQDEETLDSYKDQVKKMLQEFVSDTYGKFFEENNLSPEKRQKVTGLLVENQMLFQDLSMMLADENATADDILARQEELNQQQQEKIQGILGSDELSTLEKYEKNIPLQRIENQADAALGDLPSDGDNSLSEGDKAAAREALINAEREEMARAPYLHQSVGSNLSSTINRENLSTYRKLVSSASSPEGMESIAKEKEQTLERKQQNLEAAGLSPKVISRLLENEKNQVEMLKATGDMIRNKDNSPANDGE